MYEPEECGREEYAKKNEIKFCDDERTKKRLGKVMVESLANGSLSELISKLNYLATYSTSPEHPTRATIGAESHSETDFWVCMETFFFNDGKIWKKLMWRGGLNYHASSEPGYKWSVNT